MKKIYLIPGLATDERLFHRTLLPGLDMAILKWPAFERGDDMQSYGRKFLSQLELSKPFLLLGVSFGGMCATELAKIAKPEKLILISSAKGADELPGFIKMFKYFPLHKLLPQPALITMSEAVKFVFGRHQAGDRELLLKMLRECPEKYLNGSIHCIVNWRGKTSGLKGIDVLHIHGTADRVIPIRNIKNAIKVKGGNHFMVLNQAERINLILQEELKLI